MNVWSSLGPIPLPESPTHDLTYTRNARASTSPRSTGFCVIWDCVGSSSSSRVPQALLESHFHLLLAARRGSCQVQPKSGACRATISEASLSKSPHEYLVPKPGLAVVHRLGGVQLAYPPPGAEVLATAPPYTAGVITDPGHTTPPQLSMPLKWRRLARKLARSSGSRLHFSA